MTVAVPVPSALFNPTPLPLAVWADALASAVNQNGAVWRNSPSASAVEARVIRWLCELVGYGPQSFGTLTSGGSEVVFGETQVRKERLDQIFKTTLVISF